MGVLNQIVAIEKGVKSRVYSAVTELHKESQKPDLYAGFSKQYRKKDEDGEDYPPERKMVQMKAEDALTRVAGLMAELFDVTATKDNANCEAVSDVTVDGKVLIRKAPVTYLLFLEKQMTDLRTFVENLPTLDTAEEWQKDENTSLYKTDPISTHRTKKVQKPIVLYDATKEHPAQTQLITEDVVVGYWETVKHSGALPVPRKQELLRRIETFLQAVKFSREAANSIAAPDTKVAADVFGYLFA